MKTVMQRITPETKRKLQAIAAYYEKSTVSYLDELVSRDYDNMSGDAQTDADCLEALMSITPAPAPVEGE